MWGVPGPGGCTWSGGCVPGSGGCTWSGGVPAWGVYLPGGVPARGVYLVPGVHLVPEGGVPGPGGVYLVPGGVPGQVLPPCGQTHACKNITFATSLRTVIKIQSLRDSSYSAHK